jgi:multidrug efflux pump subunit AcrB
VQFGQSLDYPTLSVNVSRERAGLMGVEMIDVSRSLVAATSSSRFVVPNYWADPNSGVAYQIQVQIPQATMSSVEELENLPVAYSNGQPVLLRSVGSVTEGTTPGQYERYNMERMITVTANLDGDLGTVAEEVRAALAELGAPPARVSVALRGQVVPMEQMLDGLQTGLLLAMVVVFVASANFQSYGCRRRHRRRCRRRSRAPRSRWRSVAPRSTFSRSWAPSWPWASPWRTRFCSSRSRSAVVCTAATRLQQPSTARRVACGRSS